jgi:IgGFc binding protein/Bacterial Ig-like domain (group 1)
VRGSYLGRRSALVAVTLVLSVGVLVLGGAAAAAQDSKGTEHWLMLTQNLSSENRAVLVTSDVDTSGTVSIPGLSFTAPFTLGAGTTATVPLPAAAVVDAVDTIGNLGIRVTALAEVTVYVVNAAESFSTGAYLGLPTDALGSEHIVLGYRNGGALAGSQFGVVASENATAVTITPTVSVGPRLAGVPYTITMNAGQTYQLREGAGTGDLSGTIVSSDKPVAVFGGHMCANVPPLFLDCDHAIEQLPSTDAWGERFLTMPLATRLDGDTFRFVAAVDDTTVNLNGALLATLDRGQVLEQIVTEPAVIESSNPILVGQYSNGTSFDGAVGDPFMMLVPPTEQHLASYAVTTPSTGFTNFLNVVAPTGAVGSITLDGTTIPAASFTAIGTSGFSGAQVPVEAGAHSLQGSLPFGVNVYGLAEFDGYGYQGGASFSPVAEVAAVTLTPEDGENVVGTQHCVTATVTDAGDGPLESIRVDFAVSGVHTRAGFGFTNASGQSEFCYLGSVVGDDTIRASVGSTFDTATKTWVPEPPRPVALSLTPETASNQVNTQHCVTATVTDQNGAAFAGASVDFSVTGVNPGTGSGTTDANGEALFCYTGTVVGDDLIRATSGQLTDTATKTWTPEPPRATVLSLTPDEASNTVNTEHCVTATVTDQTGAAFAGATVAFAVTGVNPGTGSGTTDANGEALFCYTGTVVGDDLIRATSGQLTDTATKTWTPEPPRATVLSLTPEDASNTVNTEHCVTATVTDQNGAPFAGAAVDFVVTGVNPGTGSGTTGANGEAPFCYTGTTTGDDTIRATSGQLTDTATKTWTPEPPRATALALTPETGSNPVDTEHCVTATVTDQNGAPFAGAAVDFVVTGVNPRTGSGPTGANGAAPFCYTGTVAGDDTIRATSGQLTDTATKTWTPVAPTRGAAFLVLDEESVQGNAFKARGNGSRDLLPYFADHVGEALTVKTGQSGDEAWFAPNCIPQKWLGGSGNACLEGAARETAIDNYFGANGPAAIPSQSRLDKVPAVMPLRALGLTSLVGEDVCAVVYDSDVGVNYNTSRFPFTDANLQGKTLGVVAFRVDAVTRKSSGSLPQVTLTILDASVCGDWVLFNAPVPSSSSEPSDSRADRPDSSTGGKGYRQLRVRPEKDLFY